MLDQMHQSVVADLGIRFIINNHPDAEAPDQPSSAEIEAAAKAVGFGYRYIPVLPGQVFDEHVAAFGAAMSELDSPILTFATGSRSASLWALSAACDKPASDLLSITRIAGYHLIELKLAWMRVDARHQHSTSEDWHDVEGTSPTFMSMAAFEK